MREKKKVSLIVSICDTLNILHGMVDPRTDCHGVFDRRVREEYKVSNCSRLGVDVY